jgi:hypothetical protein
MMDAAFFKTSELRNFLVNTSKNFIVTNLRDWSGENAVILRHDVDFDVLAAYRMFQLENEIGIRSGFFFMTTSEFYNISSSNNRRMIREMAESGVDIGIHFDPLVYGSQDLSIMLSKEVALVENIIDQEVRSVSLHNPSVHRSYPIFEGYKNAYDHKIFSQENYISDSCMDFRGKSPWDFLQKAKDMPVQLLLHPIHYTREGHGYDRIMYECLKGRALQIDDLFSVNWHYNEDMKGRSLWCTIHEYGV